MPIVGREIVALDVDKFQEIVKSDDVVIIHLSAQWCGPCRAFTTVFREAAGNHDDVVFASLDTDSQPELGSAFNVNSIPAIAVMRGGALIFTHEGSVGEAALNDVIRQARAIEVGEVHRSVTSG
ncbi:thioredoxin family protein [Amycolatopsis speibonae]|uniref:Thioredoxin family protein n=1 Tax=Amycolatopsis speibonae TaxID=1450224 RepID=A0ABV7P0M5_9PSEU